MFGGNQKTKQLRQKIAELSKIDPNSYLSKEELQKKRKRFVRNEINVPPTPPPVYSSENSKKSNIIAPSKEVQKLSFPKKIFAFDTNYYRTLHSEYNNVITSNNIQPSKLTNRQLNPQTQVVKNQPTKPQKQASNLIQLVPVNNQKKPSKQQEKQKDNVQQKQVQKTVAKVTPPTNEQASNNIQTVVGQSAQGKAKQQILNIFAKNNQNKQSGSEANKINPIFGKPLMANKNIFSDNQIFPQTNSVNKQQPSQITYTQPSTSSIPSLFNVQFPKQENNKLPTETLIKQQKRSFSQPLAETKKIQVKSIFDRSNQGSLNLNPAKTISSANLFQKNKQQPTKNIFQAKSVNSGFPTVGKTEEKPSNLFTTPAPIFQTKPISSIVPLFGKTEEKPSGLFANPVPPTTQAKSSVLPTRGKTEEKPLGLFTSPVSSTKIQTKNNEEKGNIFGGTNLFGKSSTPNNSFTTSPKFGQNAPLSNLFTSNNNVTENKPSANPVFSQPIPKLEEKIIPKPTIAQPEKEMTKIVPSIIESKPSPISLFQNNSSVSFNSTNNNGLFASSTQPSFFSSQPKPLNQTANLFQNNASQQMNKQWLLKATEPEKSKLLQQQPTPKPVEQKKPEKEQKKGKGIGPGGQTIEFPLTFQNDKLKKSPFQSSSEKTNLFSSLGNSKTPNLFNQPTPTNQPSINLFSQNTGNSLFGNSTNQLFNSSSNNAPKSLFGNTENSLFSKQNKAVEVDDEEDEDEDDDGPIAAEDDANPELGVIQYDYIQTNTFFKEPANKFRESTKETLENISISIEQFQNSQHRYLYVRMPNKCVAFCGKFLKKVTQVRVLNNSKKNIEIKKILLSGEKVTNLELVFVKIQFKDQVAGEKFLKEVENAIREDVS